MAKNTKPKNDPESVNPVNSDNTAETVPSKNLEANTDESANPETATTPGVTYDPVTGKYGVEEKAAEEETETSSEPVAEQPEAPVEAEVPATEKATPSGNVPDTTNFRDTVIPESMTPEHIIPEGQTDQVIYQIQVTAQSLRDTFEAHEKTTLPPLSEAQVAAVIGNLEHLGIEHSIEKSEDESGFAVVLKDLDSSARIPASGYYKLLPDYSKPAK